MRPTDIALTNPVLRTTPWQPGSAAGLELPVLVSLTDFHIDGYRDLLRVARTGLRIQRGWAGREGSVGLALWVHPLRKRLGSLSAWKSEDDYRRWVDSSEHTAAVQRHRDHMQRVSSPIWWMDRFDVAEAWDEVGRRWALARS